MWFSRSAMSSELTKPRPSEGALWTAAAPAVFVFLWGTGFIGAKYGLPYAEPMTFLAIRFASVAAILALVVAVSGAPRPARGVDWGHAAVAGLLMQFGYLGGVFASIGQGVEAGVSALIVGVQPVLTAVLARPLLGERMGARQWLGLALGLGGVALVVARKLDAGVGSGLGVWFSVAGLFGISLGAIYQKRYCEGLPMRSANAIQFAAAAAACGLCALVFETREVAWTGEFILAFLWLTLVLSLGAVTLLYALIKRGEATRVASLFFLVPPVAAAAGWLMFGETFGPVELFGLALTAAGVWLVNKRA